MAARFFWHAALPILGTKPFIEQMFTSVPSRGIIALKSENIIFKE